jgi:hypothetical protein
MPPQPPRRRFNPNKSGILRPLTFLSFRDRIIYQAIAHLVADRMTPVQD